MKARPGAALRVRHAHESGPPEVVALSHALAARLVHSRSQALQDEDCEVYLDPRTGEVYAQPVSNERGSARVTRAAPESRRKRLSLRPLAR